MAICLAPNIKKVLNGTVGRPQKHFDECNKENINSPFGILGTGELKLPTKATMHIKVTFSGIINADKR